MNDIREYSSFLLEYAKSRLLKAGHSFEGLKNIIVALLVVKRGKYSLSFLNTSFFLLVVTAMVGGPIIAENNPFVSSLDQQAGSASAATLSYNPSDNPLSTVISAKPRDTVVEYKVLGGDTLASIAQKFDVSADSIKWASDLSSNTIKPGQTLKIPPVTGIVHTVSSGETIYTIAKKYGTDAQKIVNFPFNDFADLDTFSLRSGQVLYVPDGVPPAAPRPVLQAPAYAQVVPGVKGSSNFAWPTSGIITQYPVWYHMALDIANNAMPAILASDGGTVVFSGCIGYGYGCHIIIDHGNGYQTLYGHMSQLIAHSGQVVSQGQQIGVMGATGRATGIHLHFEIRQGGTQLNPLGFLK